MNKAAKNKGAGPTGGTAGKKEKDREQRDAMSPSIRQLIIGWGEMTAPDGTSDPDAYGRPTQAA